MPPKRKGIAAQGPEALDYAASSASKLFEDAAQSRDAPKAAVRKPVAQKFCSTIAAHADATEQQTEAVLKALINKATTTLQEHGKFCIPAFVSLRLKKLPARQEVTRTVGKKVATCKARPERKSVLVTALKPFQQGVVK